MNLKKEIKLSNLVPKPKRRELVGLKIGASQLAASRVANNGSARVLQLARQHLPAGIVVAGDVRDIPALAAALDEFFRTQRPSAPRRPPRRCDQPDRRSCVRPRRDRGRAAARERDPLPRPRGDRDPGRRRSDRLPRRSREQGRERGVEPAHRAGRGLSRVARPLCRRLQGGGHRARRHRPRGLCSSTRRRASGRG